MWATPDQSCESLIALYRRVGTHSSATIDALSLDTIGQVPWWTGDRSAASLHEILVHLIAETHRHAGHTDLVRELNDGEAGLRQGNDNMPPADRAWWEGYPERVEAAAQESAQH
ncbi:hypothetical protein RCH22_004044 [Cryobacterium psychrotolerans]|nr:hypothetical protein [Cryobacterium psychrotolerans]